jgi:hypothetical protein
MPVFPRGFPGSGTCRFCKLGALDSDMVKYGVRHYAHPVCLYRAKGIEAIDALQTWQIRHLPVLLMMEAGVSLEKLEEWNKRIKADEAANAKRTRGNESATSPPFAEDPMEAFGDGLPKRMKGA